MIEAIRCLTGFFRGGILELKIAQRSVASRRVRQVKVTKHLRVLRLRWKHSAGTT